MLNVFGFHILSWDEIKKHIQELNIEKGKFNNKNHRHNESISPIFKFQLKNTTPPV